MTRRLILLRHGQTEYNATRRMQGHLNTELSEVGYAQAQQAADFLATLNITRIISSDLNRAYDTACAVGDRLGVEVTKDERLRETHLGVWQARLREEVDSEFPGMRAYWRHDPTWAPPGGESRIDVARRARPVVDELMREMDTWDDGTVLMVAHGGTISALTSSLLELDISQYKFFSGLGNTCWAQLSARPRYKATNGDDDEILPPKGRFDASNVDNAEWYLDGWNMGVALGRRSIGSSDMGEAGQFSK
ncbi:histidine phosphatase family protein [Corynebacterium felinum]|uniref:Phosphoglycerate mutase n=1 Tax=Corynebacterium felinum TaxID=131318 RepID=A0ABU2B865_9CORY|nr:MULTISPECIES: histidine phosphatase family protein [Corynebacterium]MDF5819658.1 histidine phosphatase family protein [Corynebacterium felinum]MDO4761399.1 histidine phosphatase family protein [Corynebacterium sp.]MDR7353584.1 putative phosphoglycerate mutase [Corynebacterium felinum]WJY95764.1 Glucosyl-3-phosphoglycerate phosphatase [Corynebacterium felinum]